MKMKMSKMISINWSDFWATNSPPFWPLTPSFSEQFERVAVT